MREALIASGLALLDLDPDGVARLRLNRADAANGMNVEFLRALHEAIMRCHRDPRVRVVVLSGAGQHFCAGGDVKAFAAQGPALPGYLREATAWLQLVTAALIQLPAPVIAQVHGFAAGGGGLGLVCAADIVVAAESAKFFSGAVRVGMAPDAGSTVTLPQLVGLRQAMYILLANPTLTAAEALALGIVTEVVPDGQLGPRAGQLASALARSAPLALAATKRLVWGGVGATVAERLPEEARAVCELSGTEDSREGLAAVLEHRRPTFSGR